VNSTGVRPDKLSGSELVKGQPAKPKAWEQEPTLACFLVRESAKRREEGERGVRINPENYIVEDVEGYTWTRRQHLTMKMPNRESLPGAWAHIETPGERTEQERPIGNRGKVEAGAGDKGRPESTGVKGRWESDPLIVVRKPVKGTVRTGGAKGRAEQGAWRRER
jgi:hypothetical protein